MGIGVLELQRRLREAAEGFRDNPKFLPRLTHVRYGGIAGVTQTASTGAIKGGAPRSGSDIASTTIDATPPCGARSAKQKRTTGKPTTYTTGAPLPTKHTGGHQMHRQHRESIIKVLSYLFTNLDVVSMEALKVAPRYKRRRALYLADIFKATALSRRTVQRCLSSLVRAGYLLRFTDTRQIYITYHLLRDLRLSRLYEGLKHSLSNLARKGKGQSPIPMHKASQQPTPSSSPGAYSASFEPAAPAALPPKPKDTSNATAALSSLRQRLGMRTKAPPEPSG